MDGTVLVADDDRTIRTVLTQALTRAGCKVHATSSLVTLKRWVEEGKGDLIITDVVMPDGNGIEFIPEINQLRPEVPVIVISAQNTIMTAIQAEEAQAFDYLPKPFDLPDLLKRSARALEKKRMAVRQPDHSTPSAAATPEDLPLVGRTAAMQDLYRLVARIMNSTLPVLIAGESGTGKSLIAKAIHDFSDRRDFPFVAVTSADLASEDGAARLLARVGEGSLLLDEVGDLEDQAQLRLVRLLDALPDPAPRIIATSQVDLTTRMEAGAFRQDLYYRLAGVTIDVPSLRDRLEDIEPLIEHFQQRAQREGLGTRQFDEAALGLMRAQRWPGNVRQLENLVRRLIVTGGEGKIAVAELEQVLGDQVVPVPREATDGGKLSESVARHLQRYFDLHGGALPPAGLYQRILREVEVPLIEISLDATGGNQLKCADLLGINRNTLRKKISEQDIHVTRRRKLM